MRFQQDCKLGPMDPKSTTRPPGSFSVPNKYRKSIQKKVADAKNTIYTNVFIFTALGITCKVPFAYKDLSDKLTLDLARM